MFTHHLVAGLAPRADVELAPFAMTRHGPDDAFAGLGVEVERLGGPPGSLRVLRRLWERSPWPALERWVGPVDIVHGANFVAPPARAAPVLLTVHDLGPEHDPDSVSPDAKRFPAVLRRLIGRGAHVHANSEFVAGQVLDRYGLGRDRVHVVPCGVAPAPTGDVGRGRTRAGAERYVLFLGTIEPASRSRCSSKRSMRWRPPTPSCGWWWPGPTAGISRPTERRSPS